MAKRITPIAACGERERITSGDTIAEPPGTGQNSPQSIAGNVMQAVFIASLFVSVTLTTFLLAVGLTNLVGPMLGLTIH